MDGRVAALRRYPVKAMGGEQLDVVALDARGLVGDRLLAVTDDEGRFASAKSTRRFRRRDGVTAYAAVTSPAGDVRVSGPAGTREAGDPALVAELSSALGVPVTVTAEADVPHQDAGAVSLVGTATLAWCAAAWGVDADPRRLRVNVVVDTDEPFVEESWVGSELLLGDARLRVVQGAPRCRTVDIEQDGVRPRERWLPRIAAERDNLLAVYADVARPAPVAVGDPVRVVGGTL